MMEPVIKIENLGKKYILSHHTKESYTTLRDVISNKTKSILSGKGENKKANYLEEFWALKDISFEINRGEKIGIIGRNGAGKSTLLKILSQITEPTAGRVTINGTIASLLEVGTGFHPELSGRENIFLNGAILGMGKREIESKFDEIVAFSEVEKFLDTPVKRYSSGMYVRLAFSVAAHLDPDILIVDEVLAVGDAAFQKKCLGKIEEISSRGKTVLFVSHNMSTIMKLCNKAILLNMGKIEALGDVERVVDSYYRSNQGTSAHRIWNKEPAKDGNEVVRLIETRAQDENMQVHENYDITKPIGISMSYEVLKDGEQFTHSMNVFNEDGVHLFSSHDTEFAKRDAPSVNGTYTSTMWIPGNMLAEGNHVISIAIMRIHPFYIYFHEMDALRFTVRDYLRGDSARGNYTLDFPGVMRPLLKWQTIKR